VLTSDARPKELPVALTSEQILDLIEASRIAGHLSNDQARAASMALVLEGHEAMLAARMLGNGGDPASVEYLATGEVSELVARAHLEGPGVYTDPYAQETGHYLLLCSQSEDESAPTPTLRGRITRAVAGAGLISAGQQLGQRLAGAGLISMAADERDLPTVVGLITGEREKIRWLPSATMTIQGVETRLYASDRGFANAYWQGHKHAATFNVDSLAPRDDSDTLVPSMPAGRLCVPGVQAPLPDPSGKAKLRESVISEAKVASLGRVGPRRVRTMQWA
jgi:hypothetical protein